MTRDCFRNLLVQELLLNVYLSNKETPPRWVADKLHRDVNKTGLAHIIYLLPESDEESTATNKDKGKGKSPKAEETTSITTSST